MKKLSVRRAVAGLSLAALAGVGLVSVPTAAHATFGDDALLGGEAEIWSSCAVTGGERQDYELPWKDDGVPVAGTATTSATATGEGDDVTDLASSHHSSVTSSPVGSGPATISGTVTATASALARQASTSCETHAQSFGIAQAAFTLSKPMWVTVTASAQSQIQGTGQGASWVGIGNSSSEIPLPIPGFVGLVGDGLVVVTGNRGTTTSSTLLPAGEYAVAFVSQAGAWTDVAEGGAADEGSASYTGNFRIDLQAPGSASATTGKGAAKVQFGERDCASGNVPVNLSKKTVKKAKRVAVRVNGAKGPVLKGKKLKGKHPKAKSIMVPTSATGETKVKVKITLANGRRVQATRAYLPCK